MSSPGVGSNQRYKCMRVRAIARRIGLHLLRRVVRVIHAANLINEVAVEGWRTRLKSCGQRVYFQPALHIEMPENVEVGDKVSLGAFVHIWGGGGVRIGNGVMIGSHAVITSLTHDYNVLEMRDTLVGKPVVIEDHAWLGAHSVILPGITIGRGAVVGAGAVVTKDVPPRTIVAGAPAKVIRSLPESIVGEVLPAPVRGVVREQG